LDIDDVLEERKERNTIDNLMSGDDGERICDDMNDLDIRPRNTAPESGLGLVHIQGLEEVTEMTEESDETSHLSYLDNEDLCRSQSSASSRESEINDRIQMADKIIELEKQCQALFLQPPIVFAFDFEDYDNCKLNCKLKKLIG